jgi:DNA polymerase/3'-5' exonuclease PolX
MDYKQIIIDSLETLRKRDVADKQVFKARAYAKVIGQLKDHTGPVRSMEDLEGIEGIGQKIKDKIGEIMETGALRSAERAKQEYALNVLDDFQHIYGVGPAKASELVKMGFRSIEDLRAAVAADPKILNDKQKIGLAYYEDLLQRIPRAEMMKHQRTIQLANKEFEKIEIVGSYRRGSASSGDIDALIHVPKKMSSARANKLFESYVDGLVQSGYIIEILALGAKKCMAICRIGSAGVARRLDLLMTPDEEYAYALLYFTGSDKFNVAFRQYCIQRGYTLNEHTMKAVKENVENPPPMESEKDIFDFLGLRYVDPKERVDKDQVVEE